MHSLFKRPSTVALTCLVSFAFACLDARAQQSEAFKSLDDLDRCIQSKVWEKSDCREKLWQYQRQGGPPVELCADAYLLLAVRTGLTLPGPRRELELATQTLASDCFNALRPTIEKETIDTKDLSNVAKHACPVLIARDVKLKECAVYAKIMEAAHAATVAKLEKHRSSKIDLSKAKFGPAQVFVGSNGERVAFATIDESEMRRRLIVVRVWGIPSRINQKVIVLAHQPTGIIAEVYSSSVLQQRQYEYGWVAQEEKTYDRTNVSFGWRHNKIGS
jgi:hypothetical protein